MNPKNIAVIGGSDDITKAGGKVLKNLLGWRFQGRYLCRQSQERPLCRASEPMPMSRSCRRQTWQ
ncbi:MAG: hypothetical protein MZV63_05655 [Marinilabiliales bacterium]|nr:hypothetical protein [Marinilabiliales bacterium]